MSSFLQKVAQAASSLKTKTPLPDYQTTIAEAKPRLKGTSRLEIFSNNLRAVHGRLFTSVNELAAFLTGIQHTHGYCDPALIDTVGSPLAEAGLTVSTTYDRARYDAYQFGITRATGAIAESGTLIIDDHLTSHRLAALTPWVHIAVLDRATIHLTIADALAALGSSPNVIWITGPSKTADVEGILIEGVHGPGEQIALVL